MGRPRRTCLQQKIPREHNPQMVPPATRGAGESVLGQVPKQVPAPVTGVPVRHH